MQDQLLDISIAIDELDQMIMSLPLQHSRKQQLTAALSEIWSELEDAVQLRSSDFE